MQLREFVNQNPHGIQANESGQHAAEQMRRHNVGSLPVFEHDRLAGVITDRDLVTGCMAAGHDAGQCAVQEHMTADPLSIDANASIDDALGVMSNEQVRRLVVMDNGQLMGMVSIGDMAVRAPESAEVAQALARISQPIRVPVGS